MKRVVRIAGVAFGLVGVVAIGSALVLLPGYAKDAEGSVTEEAFLDTYRDKIIQNWQSEVPAKAKCSPFKEKFSQAGMKFSGAQREQFMATMMNLGEEAKRSGCIKQI